MCRGAQRRREPCRSGDILHPNPQAHTTRHRTPDWIYSQLLQHQNCPNTHCDAGDVLLALIARHLHRWFFSLLRRGPLSVQRDVRITAGRRVETRRMMMMKKKKGERAAGMVAVDPWEATNWGEKKTQNYLSTPDRVLAASRSPPMHQTFPSQTESDKRGGRDHGRASSP